MDYGVYFSTALRPRNHQSLPRKNNKKFPHNRDCKLELLSILQYLEVHSDHLLKSPINKDPIGE